METSDRGDAAPSQRRTTVERTSDLDLVVTRTLDAPARLVFEAWTRAELFRQWWVPKSAPCALESCEMDVRVGGGYRLVFTMEGVPPMAFYGRYLEVVPAARLVWTNDESGEAGQISTVTFVETDGRTTVTLHERYPTKAALDDALASGSTEGLPETFDQLAALLAAR
jgi:uncharacterized protein YndB with AHSA1/START domain